MANFSSFEYGSGTVYGPSTGVDVSDIDIITPKLVKITYTTEMVLNPAYFDIENYSIQFYNSASTDARPRRVLQLYQENSADEALVHITTMLVTDPLTEGQRYTFMVNGLISRGGVELASTPMSRTVVRTKTQTILRTLPDHFDKRPESKIANILAAIGISDDLIGGSKREELIVAVE